MSNTNTGEPAFAVDPKTVERIQADYELFLKFHRADPAPIGFIGGYSWDDIDKRTMTERPSVDRPHPVYRAAPSKMTTLEWQNDSRTQELMAVIRAQDAMLKARQA
jgi:hypothetical protein